MSPYLRDEAKIARIASAIRGRRDLDDIIKCLEEAAQDKCEELRLTKIAVSYERSRCAMEYMRGLKEAKAGGGLL